MISKSLMARVIEKLARASLTRKPARVNRLRVESNSNAPYSMTISIK